MKTPEFDLPEDWAVELDDFGHQINTMPSDPSDILPEDLVVEPSSRLPAGFLVRPGQLVSAAVMAPHLLYPGAFQSSPDSFVVGVVEQENGERISPIGIPTRTENID